MRKNNIYYRGLEFYCDPPFIFHEELAKFQEFLQLHLPCRTVIDIGAHHGSLVMLAAQAGAGKIHAYEPFHFDQLKENVCQSDYFDRVYCSSMPVMREAKINVPIWKIDDGGMMGALYKTDKEPDILASSVSFASVLSNFETIDYLKIDCEGSEFDFLIPDKLLFAELARKVGFLDLEIHWEQDEGIGLVFLDEQSPYMARCYAEAKGRDRKDRMMKLFADVGFETVLDRGVDFLAIGPRFIELQSQHKSLQNGRILSPTELMS